MDRFRKEDIPFTVAVIDMDWHWQAADLERTGDSFGRAIRGTGGCFRIIGTFEQAA